LLELVKAIQEKFGVSIQGAIDLIFADVEIQKLTVTRIQRMLNSASGRCTTSLATAKAHASLRKAITLGFVDAMVNALKLPQVR
tara:strand:- start:530 stop:781 length:252 start_codon:yes stop_codon:yes gene_type:complete